MCRMLGIRSRRPEPAAAWLLEAPQSLRRLSCSGEQPAGGRGAHGDGWGIAWRRGAGVELEMAKSGRDAGSDPAFAATAAAIETDLLLAHVRKASKGEPSEANAHPFRAGPLVLAHNGTIREGVQPAPGSTDSEAFSRWLAARWDGGEADGLAAALAEAARGFTYSALNVLVSDGRRLFALRCFSPSADHERYYTLYVKDAPDRTLVASEPLDGDPGWRLLNNGELLVAEAAGAVETMRLELPFG